MTTVIAQFNPFSSDKKIIEAEDGKVSDIIKNIDHKNILNAQWRILLNDEIITDYNRKTQNGDTLYVKIVPAGDNQETGTGMKIGGAALAIIGVIVGVATSWTGIGLFIGAALVGSGVGMLTGGVVLYNLDMPSLDDLKAPKQDPSIRGSKNQTRPGGYIPVLLGQRRIYPDLAATSYTWIEGGQQYLYQLFCCGQKDQIIDTGTIKIGETFLKDYSATGDMQKILNGRDPLINMQISYGDSVIPIYKKCVHEEQIYSVLKNKTDDDLDGSIIRTTPDKTTEINVDIFFPQGIGRQTDKFNYHGISVGVWYKKSNEPDTAYQPLGGWGHNDLNPFLVGGEVKNTLRFAMHKDNLPADRYTVKITRITPDNADSKIIDTCYIGSVRSLKNEQPISAQMCTQVTVIGLKIKASEKLSNVIDQLNFISQSKMPAYTGNAWVYQPSSNPASAAIYAMQGAMAQQQLTDTDIDWAAFQSLFTWCKTHDYSCSEYISDSITISQLLSLIASTCRSDISRINGKITVVQDIKRSGCMQLFTPRNSFSYRESILMPEIPDALRFKFIDPQAGFAENSVMIYNTPDGNKTKEPDTVQDINLWGVTDSVQARKIGMYKYAVSRNRPIIHSFSCDFEYLMCTKGDWIKYAGDIALAGISQGRVAKVITNNDTGLVTGIASDETLMMENGKQYALRVRKNNGEIILAQIRTTEGKHTEVTFNEPMTVLTAPKEGDLFAFGTQDNETINLIITDIQCGDNLSATLTCVEYAPEIFDVDLPDFILPEFDSKITDVPGVIDGDKINIADWSVYFAYNDSADKPGKPTGDGTSDGWYRFPTDVSKWMSQKNSPDAASGEWSEPIPMSDKSIRSVTEQYYLSKSQSELTGGAWQDTPPAWQAGRYYWTHTVVTYTTGEIVTTDPISISGQSGGDGVGIVSVDVLYGQTSDPLNPPTDWQTTPPVWQSGKYIWSKTVTEYSDGQTSESKPACITGAKGSDGKDVIIMSSPTTPAGSYKDQLGLYKSEFYKWDGSTWINQAAKLPTDPVLHYSFDEIPDVPDNPTGRYDDDTVVSISNYNIKRLINGDWQCDAIGTDPHLRINKQNMSISSSFILQYAVKAVSLSTGDSLISEGYVFYTDNSYDILKNILVTPEIGEWQKVQIIITPKTGKTASYIRLDLISGTGSDPVKGTCLLRDVYIGNGFYKTPIIDNSGRKFNAENTVLACPGVSGKAANFIRNAGNNICGNKIITKMPEIKNDITISFWITFKSLISAQTVFQSRQITGKGLSFFVFDSTNFRFDYGDKLTSLQYDISPDTLYHIVISGTTTAVKLYINSDLIHYRPDVYGTTIYNTDAWFGLSGTNSTALSGNNLNAILDDFQIYDRELSTAEVLGLYLARANTPKLYTLANYQLDQSNGYIDSITPKYLGMFATAPGSANHGDWYLNKATGDIYRKYIDGWIKDNSPDKLMSAMSDLLTIADTVGSTPTFIKNLVACNLYINNLLANSAFIQNLGTKNITLASGGSIKSDNYIANNAGFILNSNGKAEFVDVKIAGKSSVLTESENNYFAIISSRIIKPGLIKQRVVSGTNSALIFDQFKYNRSDSDPSNIARCSGYFTYRYDDSDIYYETYESICYTFLDTNTINLIGHKNGIIKNVLIKRNIANNITKYYFVIDSN